jgi:ABC-type multidrug transport system fused ATPase/permease subunit
MVEQGTHAELLALGRHFYQLARLQSVAIGSAAAA